LLAFGVSKAFLVPPEGLKYRYRLFEISRESLEILQRLQKNYRPSGKLSEVQNFPEGLNFFQRLSGTVLAVLKRRF
jgi:hypothetical protein